MLPHKRIIKLSLYHYKKACDGRSFHATYSSFLRKVASSRKRFPEINSIPQEPIVAGNFNAQPLKNACDNFYGIESDEGVIHISDKPNTLKTPQNTFINNLISKQLPEKFKKTKFGKVRLDTENKVILHGQFEESTSLSDIEEKIRVKQSRNLAIEDSEADASLSKDKTQVPKTENQNNRSVHLNNTKYQKESDVKLIEADVGETQNISLIDELYFPDKILQNQESHPIDHVNPSMNAEGSKYVDECYFNNESIKENADKAIHFRNEKGSYKIYDSDSLHAKSSLPEEELGYIDQSFFDTTPKSMNTKENVKFISETVKQNNSQIENFPSSSKNENMSFIDECFFNEDLEVKVVGKNSQNSIENLSLIENPVCQDNDKENKSNQIYSENKPVYKSNTEINMECQEDKNPNFKINAKVMDTMEEANLYYNSSKLNQHNDTFTKVVSSNKNTNFTYKETMKESLNSAFIQEPISDIGLIKKYTNPEKLNQNPLKNNKMPLIEKQNEKEINKDDQPETAFDFVKKFRGDQKVTYHESISGFTSAPKEKLDSKGLRILKYQVPVLKYFTRDEMLELLSKNVLYSDDDVVVLNKPYNLVMHDSKSTKDACLSKYLDDLAGVLDRNNKNPKLLTVHRLDKETTGCLLLARNEASAQNLKSLFAQRKIVKTYWIVTIRVPDPLEGIIDIPITEGIIEKKARMVLHPNLPKDIAYKNHSKRGKNAVTHYNVIAESGNAALVEVKPETGIKHQIRVHFGLGLACPILGDNKYSYPDKFVPQKLSNDLLHRLKVQQSKVRHIPMHIYARSIFIPQYTTGRNLFVMAPMPIHMSKNLQMLKFRKK